jgi:hypothetical protein
MKVLNLCCSHEHRFEGWFGSEDDYASQMERGLVACPVCGDTAITRLPTAPRLQVTRHSEPDKASTPSKPGEVAEVTPAAQWLKAVQHVLQHTDDVGERFAEEARRIHYGETEERGIRGRTTREEAQALREEGIEVVPLPLPDALKGPVQ